MPVPVKEEVLATKTHFELRWRAGVRGDGTYMILSRKMYELTGCTTAPIGENVIAVSFHEAGTPRRTILFPHTFEREVELRNNADAFLNALIELDAAGMLPPDQLGELI